MTGFRLHTLIRVAYASGTTLTPEQVVGGPAWLNSDRFDIVAKAEGDLMFDVEGRRPARVIAMLKTLIEDRFGVRVHTESRRIPAFALRLSRRDGRRGPQLTESNAECPRYAPGAVPAGADPDRWCGFRRAPGQRRGPLHHDAGGRDVLLGLRGRGTPGSGSNGTDGPIRPATSVHRRPRRGQRESFHGVERTARSHVSQRAGDVARHRDRSRGASDSRLNTGSHRSNVLGGHGSIVLERSRTCWRPALTSAAAQHSI